MKVKQLVLLQEKAMFLFKRGTSLQITDSKKVTMEM